MQIGCDNGVGGGVGVGDPAGQLFHVEHRVAPWIQSEDVIFALLQRIGHETELRHGYVTVLPLAAGKVDGSTIEAARSACFEAIHLETKAFQ